MKHIKLYEEFADKQNENQLLIDKLKENRLRMDGAEHLLNDIIINLLETIWGKEKGFNAYSASNFEAAKSNIDKYLKSK